MHRIHKLDTLNIDSNNHDSRTMTADLILDFPHQHNHRAVQFADMTQAHVVKRHCETQNVALHELWYTESEYHQMRRDAATRKRLALLMAERSSVSFTGSK